MPARFASSFSEPRPGWRAVLLGLATVFALSACGGGGSSAAIAPVTGGTATAPGTAGTPAAPDTSAKPEMRCAP
ncbi:hypothetical protein QTI33_23280 [Variovorax sp. J22P271]|uniref:hypothetical protein n=1 Tax=Variovorax davisae TaxID=3053515 RepID=UPI002578B626|nr:hypothetical protein [Variovorax sp. J22P271]MDM0035076.1 hypothetical protein [Variovorax sp. J22P271]